MNPTENTENEFHEIRETHPKRTLPLTEALEDYEIPAIPTGRNLTVPPYGCAPSFCSSSSDAWRFNSDPKSRKTKRTKTSKSRSISRLISRLTFPNSPFGWRI
ncbi:MAG: hypothetical protein IJ793_03890 [Opitutales bacterium]|nr:hypothetical protein [Opitutales bacterium]